MTTQCLKCGVTFFVVTGGPQPRCRKRGTHVIPKAHPEARRREKMGA